MTAATLGARIREAREAKQITQQYIGSLLKISRSAIAQWESDTTSPSLPTLVEIARIMDTTPEFLAFGITEGVRTVYRTPENSGLHTIDVVAFEDKGVERKIGSFAIDDAILKDISATGTADTLRGAVVPADRLIDGYARGDRVIVDTSINQPRQPGVYLYWNGFDASLAQMSATMGDNGPLVRINEGGQTSAVSLDKIKILGRVVMHWARV